MTKQKNNKKLLLVIAIAAALIVLFAVLEKLGVTNFIHDETIPVTQAQSTGPTPEQKKIDDRSNADAKKGYVEDPGNQTQPDPGSVELSANKESNGSVTVFSKLHNIASGQCKLVATNGDKQNQQTAAVIYQTEYSICAGFSIPISSLGNGVWNIALSVISDGQVYSKTLNYEVK